MTQDRWTPYVTVAAIAERDGRFLVVEEEAGGRSVYNQPAGHLERGETLPEAVRREVLEETGWEFAPEHVVGVYLYEAPEPGLSYLRVCFSGACTRHHPDLPLDAGIVRCAWMSREELEKAESRMRSPLVLRCIEDFLGGRRLPLSVLAHLRAAGGD